MTLFSGIFRSTWSYVALLVLFFGTSMLCLPSDAGKVMAALLAAMVIALCWFLLWHNKVISAYAFPIYGFFAVQIVFFFMGIPLLQTALYAAVAFLPMIAIHYVLEVGNRRIPGSGSLVLMACGFLLSVSYQTITHHGGYEYSFGFDVMFFLGISAFFVIYMLLALGVISLRYTLMAMSLSGLLFLAYIIFCSMSGGSLGSLFEGRFGSSSGINPNFIACFLDICLPLSLFLALNEKGRLLKASFFLLSLLYCLCILRTTSRGSLPGLVALALFFLIRLRSIKAWVIIIGVSLFLAKGFGERVITRTVAPSSLDILSSLTRVEMLKSGIKLLKDNYFVFGIGMDNFRLEKFKFGLSAWLDPHKQMSSHNSYLEVWLGWGLAGLVGWLSLLVGSIFRTARATVAPGERNLKLGMIFALLSYMLHGLFDSLMALPPFLVMLLSMLACMSFLIRSGSSESRLCGQSAETDLAFQNITQ